MLRRSEELWSCGVSDWSTVQVSSRMRGGGKPKDKKRKAEKKRAASPERPPKSDEGSVNQERGKEESLGELWSSTSEDVVQEGLETALGALGGMEALERLSQGNDDEVDDRMKIFLVEIKKVCCLPHVLVKAVENSVRSEVAAKRAAMRSRAARTTVQTVCTEGSHKNKREVVNEHVGKRMRMKFVKGGDLEKIDET